MSPILLGIAKMLFLSSGKNKMARSLIIAGAPFVLGFLKRKLWKKKAAGSQ